jgi:Protein of unknown function (DUF1275)
MSAPTAPRRPGWLLSAVLSTTAGAVDVVGFLALGGLFTAHITGNLVVVAAHYATGRSWRSRYSSPCSARWCSYPGRSRRRATGPGGCS